MMVTMKPIRSILCILFVLAFVIACAEKEAPPSKPAVISKKISAPATPANTDATAKKRAATPEKATAKIEEGAAAKEKAAPEATPPAAEQTDSTEVKKHTAELLASVQKDQTRADRPDGYNPKGKPDPFAPLFRDEPEQAAASAPTQVVSKDKRKKRIPTTPLEKVDLSQLKLVATVRSHNGNAALVEDASGKGFIVKKGTYIGINSGSVVQIVKDRIVVEEEIETLLGEISLQKRELKLQKPPGE
jgi:type IV pilus assembly protein PilP